MNPHSSSYIRFWGFENVLVWSFFVVFSCYFFSSGMRKWWKWRKSQFFTGIFKRSCEKIRRDELNEQFLELGNAFCIYLYQKRAEFFQFYDLFFFLGELFYELVKADNILQWSIIFHGHCHKFLNMRLADADIQHINRVAWNSSWSLYYKVVNYGQCRPWQEAKEASASGL